MIGIIVKENDQIIDKQVLFGDDDKNMVYAHDLQRKNPQREVIVYQDNERVLFESLAINEKENSDQKTWGSLRAKATDTEKLFAKMLGLDG